ncbi:hypothetical protein WJX75_008770 [Coccomyxa subellipsoidea]|uniref:Uncharacterized protein n=1 Tax=Coccomyxa subellipsoidea TaxID=248742 RepID=A0ABR2YM89_9CHLO
MFDEKEKLDTLAREVNATCHLEGITVIFDVNGWTANTAQVSKTGRTSALKKTIFHPPQAWLDKHPNVKQKQLLAPK